MAIGIITGSGTYVLPHLQDAEPRELATRFGPVVISEGRLAGQEVLHVSRHGVGHPRLSNHVTHQANISALIAAGARAVLAVTVCGAVDPTLELGDLIVFDDLYFPSNRLPDGSLCTLHTEPGDPDRAHWVFERPFSGDLRTALLTGARDSGRRVRDGGCYGHVDGPRFNTAFEISALASAGVTAVSQTAGPETVLCGEAGIPYALIGYATDHANGVHPEPTSVEQFTELLAASSGALADSLGGALASLGVSPLGPVGTRISLD